LDPERIDLKICVPPGDAIFSAAVKCRITATNLPDPFLFKLPIKIGYAPGNTFHEALRLIS